MPSSFASQGNSPRPQPLIGFAGWKFLASIFFAAVLMIAVIASLTTLIAFSIADPGPEDWRGPATERLLPS